jgi:hypothetical protein
MRKSKFIQWTNPIRLKKLTHVMKVRGVDVYIHWTVFLIVAVFVLGAIQNPGSTLVGLACYLAVIWIHETGHLIAAHRRGSEVFEIEIYPIFGITRFQTPWSRLDHCIIAWGGVIAQAVVAIPLVLWVSIFGFTPFQSSQHLICFQFLDWMVQLLGASFQPLSSALGCDARKRRPPGEERQPVNEVMKTSRKSNPSTITITVAIQIRATVRTLSGCGAVIPMMPCK